MAKAAKPKKPHASAYKWTPEIEDEIFRRIGEGEPLHFTVANTGDTKTFSTIEQAKYWLRTKWPVNDTARSDAMAKIDDAMDCIGSVTAAKQAFVVAALTAGFRAPEPVNA